MRQIVLDTETTGIDPAEGHRIIEIGCVELMERQLTGRNYHVYINPDREVEAEAITVHGITNEFLADKPRFAEIADEFFEFIKGAELVIHNAAFDVGFMDSEFARLKPVRKTADHCGIVDSLAIARARHPGQKNNLDALCKRYGVDNSNRDLHGALLDAEILADVYLLLTGGQTALSLDAGSENGGGNGGIRRLPADRAPLSVVRASSSEAEAHEEFMSLLEKQAGETVWVGDTAIHGSDALLRRAGSLQATPDATAASHARMNAATAQAAAVEEGASITLKQGEASASVTVEISERVPDNCVWLQSGTPASASLGAAFGSISIERT